LPAAFNLSGTSMKRALLALAFFSAFAANATPPGNNGGGNGGCGVGQQTNGCGSTTPVANGGAGGQGGTGIGVGIAGASANSASAANASNTNVIGVSNSVRASNEQRQSQSNRSNNTNNNQAMGGNSYASSGGNVLTQTGGDVKVNVEGAQGDTYIAPAQERNPVATAYAAPLTASNGTCMGSSSAGAQGAALGVSFGTTWTDSSCDIRYDAEALRAAGLPIAARARLCQKPEIAKAMEAAGTPCPGSDGKRAEDILNGRPVATVNLLP
jgi:hypothetical protein